MWRLHLRNIAAWACPDGFSIRPYEPGDENHWVRIHEYAHPGNHPSLDLFRGQFGTDTATLAARQFFLVSPKGAVVGTTTAWFYNEAKERNWGRIHWVAILPEHQGKGYSRALQAHALDILRELKHSEVFLTTDPERVPAVNLYLRFGFRPWLAVDEARDRWKKLVPSLKPEWQGPSAQWLKESQ